MIDLDDGRTVLGPEDQREPSRAKLPELERAEADTTQLDLARFRRHLDASGRKPGKERFRCPELGRRIPRSFAARRFV
jgi:hypothetical protein